MSMHLRKYEEASISSSIRIGDNRAPGQSCGASKVMMLVKSGRSQGQILLLLQITEASELEGHRVFRRQGPS